VCGVVVVNESISIYLALRNVVDINVEVSTLQKKRDHLIRYVFKLAHIHIQFYLNFIICIILLHVNGFAEKSLVDDKCIVAATTNCEHV
jgi:hypothetical protein